MLLINILLVFSTNVLIWYSNLSEKNSNSVPHVVDNILEFIHLLRVLIIVICFTDFQVMSYGCSQEFNFYDFIIIIHQRTLNCLL